MKIRFIIFVFEISVNMDTHIPVQVRKNDIQNDCYLKVQSHMTIPPEKTITFAEYQL